MRTTCFPVTRAGSKAVVTRTPPSGRCSPSVRSSTWPSVSGAARSATSARCRRVTGSGSAGTARCGRHLSGIPRGRKPSGRCGRWLTMVVSTARMTGGSTPWCCSPLSRVCGGVKRLRCGVAIWTWRRAPSGSGPRTSSGQPARCCWVRLSRRPVGESSASPRRSSQS